jgi:predicted transcriptional regulator YdeE
MEPKLVTREEIKLIGISVQTTNRREMNPATAIIPGLYGRFFKEQVADKIPNKTSMTATMAVYANYESDHTGAYDLILGRAVKDFSSVPAGMTRVTILPGKYLQFSAKGPMPKALIDTWTYILTYFEKDAKFERAYTTDCEVHSGSDEAEIYIAVK